MEKTPSYPNRRAVRSFDLLYVALLQNIPTDRAPPSPTVMTSQASRATPWAHKVRPTEQMGRYENERNKKQNYAKGKLRNEREQASPNGATPSQKQKPIAVIKTHHERFTWGLPHKLKTFHIY